ncbi:glycosyltransferase family 2 protein [Rubrivirga sp. S365]|uniref:glycosyltransferase family 2 protein n=1 Tax=Rubrivirga sp. S365 TaxID=3076080 RepID=UPI0028C86A57|nr:glycosyltransferase family 2 protein [Rubrivirga sp. S365]MDT7856819.1 glycosyltransferase family 2 protein [Rubrivirga sp. S365]
MDRPAPTVSVVVPCYNAESTVRRAVASALAQTAPPDAVVCVDDGSSDGTVGVLRELAAEDGRVRVLTGPNRGACAARNRGLAEATGTYVQFLDADDALDAGKFDAQVEIAERAGADFVAGASRYQAPGREPRVDRPRAGNPWVRLIEKELGNTAANLWRRSAVEAVGGWDAAWPSSQEADLMARLLKNGAAVAYDLEPRATVYGQEGSISFAFSGPNRERYARVRADALAFAEAQGLVGGADLDDAREALFNALRWLYPSNPEAALETYRRALPARYVPPVSAFNTRPYVTLSRLVGFDRAERLRRALGRGDK